ncbi:MAG: hypothetical protein JWP11_838 [Frankiales bacterium]|nr:hypothetical protein [Frankiales bacterium]
MAGVLELIYLAVRPQAPDLPAQLARASAVSRGVQLWWAGWYGGINTSTYSLISAHLMSALGVSVVGVVATAAICLFGADLVRPTERPRAGAVAVAVAACANLYSGRITFAAGMAICLASFCAFRRGHVRAAVVLSLCTGFVSPLAALCQLVGLTALLLTGGPRARLVSMSVACLLPVAVISLVFGQPSYMPFSADTCVFALLACAGVALAPVPRLVRALALVSAVLAIVAVAVHSPVGSNAARMPMLAAAPLVVATARRGTQHAKVLVVGLLVWPLISFSSDMAIAAQPSSHASFYSPLLRQLPPAGTSLQRLEVLDPRSHGAAFYLSRQVPLARGWERQIDAASNPIFYVGPLTAATYRAWLVTHAVGWVAVPDGALDYSALAEKALVTRGLPYLHQTWSDQHWRLYRVTAAAPVATGVLSATGLTDTGVELEARSAGSGAVRVPYSRLLTARSTNDPRVLGCVSPSPSGDVVITVPAAGPYVLHAEVGALARSCASPGGPQ